ncbi:MAG: long-chain fatty acid--CoA ligase [Planctomycetes bacterium]|nr:long-chain fatty acid--CoA ligase [Planctomycetota bacterium]
MGAKHRERAVFSDTPPGEAPTIAAMFLAAARRHADGTALRWREAPSEGGETGREGRGTFRPLDYRGLAEDVRALAAGFHELGVRRGDHVGLLSDNRAEWLMSDLALVGSGCVDVPRGADTLSQELVYILQHSDSVGVVVEDARQLAKVLEHRSGLPRVLFVVVMDPAFREREGDVWPFRHVVDAGRKALQRGIDPLTAQGQAILPADTATIIYTSGTTGRPKGVVLSHANLMHQVRVLGPLLGVTPEDRFLSLLPPWHIFERTVEYASLAVGASTSYSRPVRQVLLGDLAEERPTFMACVPRVLEGIQAGVLRNVEASPLPRRLLFHALFSASRRVAAAHSVLRGQAASFQGRGPLRRAAERGRAMVTALALGPAWRLARRRVFSRIRERTGGRLRAIISGGGSLPRSVDVFFQTVGIPVLEGYGLTETSPVVAVRSLERAAIGTVGRPIHGVEVRVVDPRNQALGPGERGLIQVRGPSVMRGYYHDDEATRRAIGPEGWFDTGDLGRLSLEGDLQITGRAKDTIVLVSGENVEPEPIENRLRESDLVQQVVVVGQDRRHLAALVVPDFEVLRERLGRQAGTPSELVRDPAAVALFRREVSRRISLENGFRPFEQVRNLHLLDSDFRVGEELTQTLKVRRNVVAERHAKLIDSLYQ